MPLCWPGAFMHTKRRPGSVKVDTRQPVPPEVAAALRDLGSFYAATKHGRRVYLHVCDCAGAGAVAGFRSPSVYAFACFADAVWDWVGPAAACGGDVDYFDAWLRAPIAGVDPVSSAALLCWRACTWSRRRPVLVACVLLARAGDAAADGGDNDGATMEFLRAVTRHAGAGGRGGSLRNCVPVVGSVVRFL